ncbi:MAG: dihydroorotase [Candidatus Tokpelaia sp. JSC161]|jgi:dihydroorotase|nr:MAG: dihydroorotase [Candidatus Tokpelaia sp. JSC161]
MKPILLKNARIVDPSRNIDEVGHVIIAEGKILAAGNEVRNQGMPDEADIINLKGKAIFPGLVDARVFVGEPGAEHRETIASASYAAATGGITSFIMMPDTQPVIDNVALVEFVLQTAKEAALVNIYPTASLTSGMNGKQITEFGLLKEVGAIALSEGKKTIHNANLMRLAMTYARDFDMPIIHETQDAELSAHGVMNAGLMASWLGLSGIPREAEVIPLERDLRLATLTGAQYHASQISTAMSVQAIGYAKEKTKNVSAGVSINHLTLNENDIGEYRTFFRLSPPLRAEEDRIAMVNALRDGIVDIIVSSHDPQGADTKRLPFSDAQPGATGLETLLAAALRLYHNGLIPLTRLIDSLSTKPAKIFGLDAGTLKPGASADLIIVDLHEPWILKVDRLNSCSKNSPFENIHFQGRVLATMVKGKIVFYSHGLENIKNASLSYKKYQGNKV